MSALVIAAGAPMNRNSGSIQLFAFLLILVALPAGAHAAETGSHRTRLSNGCELNYEYSANPRTEIDLVNWDKDQIGALLYRQYKAVHDLSAELAKLPGSSNATLDLPADSVQTVNDAFALGKLLESNLEFKVRSAQISCSASVRLKVEQQQRADHFVRHQKIERAISFMQDPDQTLQRRGLTSFREVATTEEFQALPAELRSQVIALVYAEAAKSIADLGASGLPRGDSFDFGAMALLYRLDDPRALDLYIATIERGHASVQGPAIRSLGKLFPRPTQVLDRLAALIEHNRINWPAKEDAIDALLLIGRGNSRPYFEKFARSHDETLAQMSMRILDQLNAQAVGNPFAPES